MSPPTRRSGPSWGEGAAGKSSGHHTATGDESTRRPRQDPAGLRPPSPRVTLAEARAERDEGAEAAELSLHTGWRLWAEAELDRLIAVGQPFTADDLRAVVGAPPDGEHVNGLGGLFLRASKAGRIETVGYRESTRRQAHARVLRVWRGVA